MFLMKLLGKTICLFVLVLLIANAWANDNSVSDFNQAYRKYNTFVENNEWAQALPYARKAYELGEKLHGAENKNVAALAYNYGLNLKNVGQDDEAIIMLEQTLELYKKVYDKNSHALIPILFDLGTVNAKTFDPDQQIKYYKRALKLSKRHYGERSADYGQLLVDAGVGIMDKSKSASAVYYLKKGHKILLGAHGSENLKTGMAAFLLGKYYIATYQYNRAAEYLLQALQAFQAPNKPSNKLELLAHGFLVEAYEGLDERDLATKHCQAIGKMTPFTSKQHYFPIVKRLPEYPELAARRGAEGYVMVEFDVDESGFVRNSKVVAREGMVDFEPAALEAANKFRYAPAFKDGVPVVIKGVLNKITFEMADD